MEVTLQGSSQAKGHITQATLANGIGWGLVGGLAGTLVMDLILMGALSGAGLPALTCYSIVGNTVARFFSILGIEIAGGVLPGVATHYLVGPVVGAIFGAAVAGATVARVDALRVDTLKRGIILAVLYVEILAQPILAMTPILLKMTAAETLLWFGGSFVMHFLFGVVLGAIVSFGLRLTSAGNRN